MLLNCGKEHCKDFSSVTLSDRLCSQMEINLTIGIAFSQISFKKCELQEISYLFLCL